MRFTENEIVFLTSVSRGRAPLGITYHIPEKEERDSYIEETIHSLIEKKLLDEEWNLTKAGADTIYLWERYRNCKNHIRLNQVNIAVLPENVLIAVVQGDKEYEVICTDRDRLMLMILKHTEYLCREEAKSERGKWQEMDDDLFVREVEEMDGYLLLYRYRTGKLIKELIYYWKKNNGYLFDRSRKRGRSLSPAVMRKQIYRALEEEEV